MRLPHHSAVVFDEGMGACPELHQTSIDLRRSRKWIWLALSLRLTVSQSVFLSVWLATNEGNLGSAFKEARTKEL
jgi:hypothetical protein